MTVKGDFKRLGQLSASLKRASKTAHQRVLIIFAVDVDFQVARCFEHSVSPYGEPWPPLQNPSKKRHGGQPLLDTGRLRSSIKVRAMTRGVRVTSNVVYAGIHNYGGTIKRYARTEMQRYGITGKDKRKRIGLASRRKRSVLKAVSFGDSTNAIPRRQFLPDEARGLPPVWVRLLRARADEVQRSMGLWR